MSAIIDAQLTDASAGDLATHRSRRGAIRTLDWLKAELFVSPVTAILAWISFRYLGGLASVLISSVFVASANVGLVVKGPIARDSILKWVPLLLVLSGLNLSQASYVTSLLENVSDSGLPLLGTCVTKCRH